jgi:hypothetical protein
MGIGLSKEESRFAQWTALALVCNAVSVEAASIRYEEQE